MTDAQILSVFGAGQACWRAGGFLADNPHAWDSEAWRLWREGFTVMERMDAERVARRETADV